MNTTADNIALSRIMQGHRVRPAEISPQVWMSILAHVYINKVKKDDLHFLFKPISDLKPGVFTAFGAGINSDTSVICQPFGESRVPSGKVGESDSTHKSHLLLIQPKDDEEQVRFATWKIGKKAGYSEIELCEPDETSNIVKKYPYIAQGFLSVIDLKSKIDVLDSDRSRLVDVERFVKNIDIG